MGSASPRATKRATQARTTKKQPTTASICLDASDTGMRTSVCTRQASGGLRLAFLCFPRGWDGQAGPLHGWSAGGDQQLRDGDRWGGGRGRKSASQKVCLALCYAKRGPTQAPLGLCTPAGPALHRCNGGHGGHHGLPASLCIWI